MSLTMSFGSPLLPERVVETLGKDPHAFGVDDGRAGRNAHLGPRSHRDDSFPGDENDAIPNRRAFIAIDHLTSDEREGRLQSAGSVGLRGGCHRREGEERGERGSGERHHGSFSSSTSRLSQAARTGGGIFELGPRTERQTISFSKRSGARSASARFISADSFAP